MIPPLFHLVSLVAALLTLTACAAAQPSVETRCERLGAHMVAVALSSIETELARKQDRVNVKALLAKDLSGEELERAVAVFEKGWAQERQKEMAAARSEFEAKRPSAEEACAAELRREGGRVADVQCVELAKTVSDFRACSTEWIDGP